LPSGSRKYISTYRKEFIELRRQERRSNKLNHLKEIGGNYVQGEFDCLKSKGGPVFVPSPIFVKFYELGDFLNALEDGFYDDYSHLDFLEIKEKYPELGEREVLETLVDLSGGDFKVNPSLRNIIDADGDFNMKLDLSDGIEKEEVIEHCEECCENCQARKLNGCQGCNSL
jgi:hypothetical protein